MSNQQPTTCLDELLRQALQQQQQQQQGGESSSGEAASQGVPREVLLACIINRLEECFQVFEDRGFGPLEQPYLRSWLHSEQRVIAYDPDMPPTASYNQPGAAEARGGAGGAGAAPPPTMRSGGADGGLAAGEPVALTIKGLSPGGFLLAVDDWGLPYELTPDGNSLDMMQGLIRRKVK